MHRSCPNGVIIMFFVFSWSVGYDGSPVYFTDENVICFINSNCLKFIDLTSQITTYLPAPGDGIQSLAVNIEYGFIAFSEDGINAKIFVYNVHQLDTPSGTLEGKQYASRFTRTTPGTFVMEDFKFITRVI